MNKLPKTIYPLIGQFVKLPSNINKNLVLNSHQKWNLIRAWLSFLFPQLTLYKPNSEQILILYRLYINRKNKSEYPEQKLIEETLEYEPFLTYKPLIIGFIRYVNPIDEKDLDCWDTLNILHWGNKTLEAGNLLAWDIIRDEIIESRLDKLYLPYSDNFTNFESYCLILLSQGRIEKIPITEDRESMVINIIKYYLKYYQLDNGNSYDLIVFINTINEFNVLDFGLLYLMWLQPDKFLINSITHIMKEPIALLFGESQDWSKGVNIIENGGFEFIIYLFIKCYDISEIGIGLYILALAPKSCEHKSEIKNLIYSKFQLDDSSFVGLPDTSDKYEHFNMFIDSIPFKEILDRKNNCIFDAFANTDAIDIILIEWINKSLWKIDTDSLMVQVVEILKYYVYNFRNFNKLLNLYQTLWITKDSEKDNKINTIKNNLLNFVKIG